MSDKKSITVHDFLKTQEMIWALFEDVMHFWKVLDKDDSQTIRRSCIRALVAVIEAALYQVKIYLIYANDKAYISLLPEELVLLSEKTYHIDKKGNAKPVEKFSPFKNTFLFIFNTLFRYTNDTFRIDKKDQHWSDFDTIIKARNRLMHPKLLSDINVTDLELKRAKQLALWNAEIQARAFFSLIKIEAKLNPKVRKELISSNFWENLKSKVSEYTLEMGVELDEEAQNFIKDILLD